MLFPIWSRRRTEVRRGAQGPAGEQRCGEVPRVPQENRGVERCPGSRRRTEVEAAVTWASGETSSPASMPRSSGSSPPPYTLALGTLPDTTHTRYCTHSDVTHDKPVAKRRRLSQGESGPWGFEGLGSPGGLPGPARSPDVSPPHPPSTGRVPQASSPQCLHSL